MISIASKFPLRTEFLSFRAKSKKLSTSNFTVYWLPATRTRCAVVVPKKVNKLATTRNWLKRLAYDHLWPLIKDKNIDLVVVFKPFSLIRSEATKENILSQINKLVLN